MKSSIPALGNDTSGLCGSLVSSLRVAGFLCKQHTPVSTSTGKTPAFMIFGRELTANISRLKPLTHGDEQQLEGTTSASKVFTEGQNVVVINCRGTPKWIPSTLVKKWGVAPGLWEQHEDQSDSMLTTYNYIHPRRLRLWCEQLTVLTPQLLVFLNSTFQYKKPQPMSRKHHAKSTLEE